MRQALGRGLDALLPASTIAKTAGGASAGGETQVHKIPLTKIRPNHLQTRRHFDPEKLSDLAQSIRENGLAQPIVVTLDKTAGTYELIAGERRWRAAQLAGLTDIDAIVRKDPTEKERLTLNLIENLQREDLNPIEEALGYLRLMKEHSLTQTQLTQVLAKSKSAVSNTLRLLDLPGDVQKALQIGQIAEGHARAMLGLKDPIEINKLFKLTLAQNLSVRDVEDYVRKIQGGTPSTDHDKRKATTAPKKAADVAALERALQQHLGTKVEIKIGKDSTKGIICVHFYSLTDFDGIVEKLKK